MTVYNCKVCGQPLIDTNELTTGVDPTLFLHSKLLSHIFYNHRELMFEKFLKEKLSDMEKDIHIKVKEKIEKEKIEKGEKVGKG